MMVHLFIRRDIEVVGMRNSIDLLNRNELVGETQVIFHVGRSPTRF